MAQPAFVPDNKYDNVVQFNVFDGGKKKDKPKGPKSHHNCGGGDYAGKSSEVYAFRTKEEIKAVIDVFDKHINEAEDEHHRQLACRNKLLFLVGLNIGLRASDLVTLRWSFFLDSASDGEYVFKEFYTLQPKKTRKQKKFVKLFFNQTVKKAIVEYLNDYPTDDLEEYLFYSREGDGAIVPDTLRKIVKNAAREAGITQNIGSHSLRKTFGFWIWHESNNKDKALVVLSQIFNHSSVQVTRRYIGITNDEMKDAFNSIELGFDFI